MTNSLNGFPKKASRIWLFLLGQIFVVSSIYAHDPGLSYAEFKLSAGRLSAQLVYNYIDLANLLKVDMNGDNLLSPEEITAAKPQLEALARSAIEVSIDGAITQPNEIQERIARAEDGRDTVYFLYGFSGTPNSQLSFKSLLIEKLAPGHREYFKLIDGAGNTISEKLLDSQLLSATIEAGELSAALGGWQTFKQFIKLGIDHILLGFDHLCFLLALLLVAQNLRGVLKIVTSFTIAHSITLALAALDKASLSPAIVEPMIAVSIVYVGLENIWRHGKEVEGRWMLTFAFGLIHGFGFASVLRDLNIGAAGSGVAIPLVSFNLGVEIGQLAVAAIAWPLICWLRKRPVLTAKLIPIGSLLVAIAGGYWLIERTIMR